MDGEILVIAVVVGFIISAVGAKKLGQLVYDKTGYNAFSGLNKFLCFLIFLLPLGIDMAGGNRPNLQLMVLSAIIPIVLLIIQNLKVKKPAYVVGLTLFQIFYGISFLLFLVIKLSLKYAFKMASFDLGVNIDTKQSAYNQTLNNARVNEDARKQANNKSADAWAQKQGFEDADAAERIGIKTGKEN